MNSYQITIVKPSAVRLLEDMAKKNLIRISPSDSRERFRLLLSKLRRAGNPPALDDITREVESVRENRRKHED